ncbi:MAG: metallophosphoesterase [Clostridia bacterium]|nr:metallophosphoesterase [Clostridia bacterium]
MKEKRVIRFLAVFVLLFVAITATGYGGVEATEEKNPTYVYAESLLKLKHTLRFNEDGKFRIVIFADIQDTYPLKEDTVRYMNQILDQEKPDLVLLAGDNHCGSLGNESQLKTYLTAMCEPMESRKIPWAQVYGNHVEGGYKFKMGAPGKEEQQKIFESFKYNVSKAGTVYGMGNYVLPILRSDSDKIGFNVFGLDTHNYLNEKTGTQQNLYGQKFENAVLVENPIYGTLFDPGGKYETIHADQIRWYWKSSLALEEYNGSKIAAMMFFHIAQIEWEYITRNPEQTNMTGKDVEGIWPSELSSGLFHACYERGDVKGMFVGHNHQNDFTGTYMGIQLGFTPTIGSLAYFSPETRGARVVEVDQDDAFNFTTRLVYCKDLDA